MGKLFSKTVADAKGADKKSFLKDFMSTMHVVSTEELKANRNSSYQYMI